MRRSGGVKAVVFVVILMLLVNLFFGKPPLLLALYLRLSKKEPEAASVQELLRRAAVRHDAGASRRPGVKYGDSPGIEWSKCLGGSGKEFAGGLQQTSDGGYIIAGATRSDDGDVSGNHGGLDGWIAKLDAAGGLTWQRCLGGTRNDSIKSVCQTGDGGYIAAGYAESQDGDVEGNNGAMDAWVIKLDAAGNILWQKCLGGSGGETANSIRQTSDGGYIAAGSTNSEGGGVPGKKDGGDAPSTDFFVFKLNPGGEITWQKRFGGSNVDIAHSVRETAGGGYIATGMTQSVDVSGYHKNTDLWLVKMDASGETEWSKCLGGSGVDIGYDVIQAEDGGYMVAGETSSPDGDVSGWHDPEEEGLGLPIVFPDFWIVKLDLNGEISWQKCFGGYGKDGATSVCQAPDGGYIAAGSTDSADGDVSGNHGNRDIWAVRFDRLGNVAWQKCLGGGPNDGFDSRPSACLTDGGGYAILGDAAEFSWAVSSDVAGIHGAEPDIWLVKLEADI